MKRLISTIIISAVLSTSFISCEDLEVENTNQPNLVDALASPDDVKSLLDGSTTNTFKHLVGFSGIFMNLMADQTTTTNASNSFWSFADQPRLQINNSSTNSDLGNHVGSNWSSLNNYIYSANTVIDLIEFKGNVMIIEDVDKTQEMLATAYFVKGLCQGYISLIFDKAYIVNPDTDLAALEFKTYTELNAESINNIDKAISIASNDSEISLQIYNGYTIDNSTFKKLANSFAAKILLNLPRTKSEANTVDYAKVLEYANKGITEDFNPPTDGGYQFYNNLQDWSTYTLSDGAGYLPTDIKVAYLFDETYPTDYPVDASVTPDPANSSDPRLTEYFEYVTAFGFLRESRGRELFTNYRHIRYYTNNDRGTLAGLSTDIFHTEELDFIKAEATLNTSGAVAAKSILDSSVRFTKGGLTTGSTQPEIEKALFYEYSIELDLGSTIGTQWMFMRRYDLLQTGTPLQYPVPGTELEITADQLYTFGGVSNGSQEGTADGSNSWNGN
ncbi:MAG: hypothetical protein ACSHW4_15170 [Cellulophaga sp.]